MLRLVFATLARYRTPALAAAACTLLTGWLVAQTRSERWVAWAELYVHEPAAIHRLANPFTTAPRSSDGMKELEPWLTSRERLVAMVKDTALLDRWGPGRPWPLQLTDRLRARLKGPIAEKDLLDALVELVDHRLDVTVDGQHVRIAVEWSSPDLAQALLASEVDALLRERESHEVRALEEAADALDEQVAGVQAEMVNRLNELNVEVLRARAEGRRPAVDAERDQLLRDQDRAGQLLLRAEEKHISAEVLRHANGLRFVVVRPALRPLHAEGPGRLARLLLALLAALVSALAVALSLAAHDGTLLSPAALERRLGLKVLARLTGPSNFEPAPVARRPWALALGFAVVCGAALGLSRGNPVTALAPTLLGVFLWQLWTRPLKVPLLALLLLTVTIDDPTDRPYVGLWHSPLYALGRFFYTNVAWFTGFELAVLGLTALMFVRRVATGGLKSLAVDPTGQSSPLLLRRLLLLSAATVAWLVVMGVLRGGVFREALWQFRALLMMPLVAMLCLHAFDFPRDLRALALTLGVGTVVKSLFGTYFIYGVAYPQQAFPPHTTGHNDTMIFVTATVLAFALVWERPTWRKLGLALFLMLFAGMAMRLNDRRIAYVDIAIVLGFLFVLSPMHRMKRFAVRAGVAMLPVLALYVAAGWNAHGGIFKPVAKVRSIVAPAADTEEESSNVERDIENYNITKSWEQNMFLGQGFGHAFTEFTPSNDFSQSRFGHIGHNSVLWLLWIGGITGFSGVLLYLALTVFLLGRTLQKTDDWRERVGLDVSLGIILTYLMQAFGDMGMLSMQFVFFVSVALAITGRLAMRRGALSWTQRVESAPSVPLKRAPPRLSTVQEIQAIKLR